jgi:hypothetical protein
VQTWLGPVVLLSQAKIDNAGGEPLRRQKDQVAKLGKKIADAEGEAAKKGVQVKAAAKQLEKLKKDVAKAGKMNKDYCT